MGVFERCVIWGDDPETRQRLGAGVPGASGHSHQGTAAQAAVPISSPRRRSGSRERFGQPQPAILALAAALAACGGSPASAGELGGDGLAMSPGTPRVDAATGIAAVAFPIEVPPGRHHLQPDLARLSPGPIRAASTYWVARGRDGRAYRFGFDGDTASGNVSQVLNFKWGLDRLEDTSGNLMEIRHQSQGLRLYPVRIEYASQPATGLPAANVVQICWERLGDEYPTPYGERFLYKLSSIVTAAPGKAART